MPVTILLMITMVISLLVILKPNFNVPFNVEIEDSKLNSKQLATLIIFIVTAILLTFSSYIEPFIRNTLALKESIKNFDAVIAMVAVVALCICNTATWSEIQERTEWGVLMLFGGGLVLSIVLRETGASKI